MTLSRGFYTFSIGIKKQTRWKFLTSKIKFQTFPFTRKLFNKNCSNSMFRLNEMKEGEREKEKSGRISYLVHYYDFCAFRYLDPHQIPRDRIISDRSIDTPILRSLYFSSIHFDVISILDHPERATFDRETRLRMIQTMHQDVYNARGFKMSSKKNGRLAKTQEPFDILSNSNSCSSIDVLLLSVISRRTICGGQRIFETRQEACSVHR